MMYYARNGDEITMEQWAHLHNDFDYKVVKQERTEKGTMVSTVWLGLDHSFMFSGDPTAPILIFETMTFASGEEYMERYTTEEEAREGHERIANMVRELEGIDDGITRQADRAPGRSRGDGTKDEEGDHGLRSTPSERDRNDPQHPIGQQGAG